MPKFDQTGPLGKGPKTGRGFGPCEQGSDRKQGSGAGRGMGSFGGGNQPQIKEDVKKEEKELD